MENVFVSGQLDLFLVRNGDGGPHNRGVGNFLSHSLDSICDLCWSAAALGSAASASRLSSAAACCGVARAVGHGHWDSDLLRDCLIPDFMGDLVIDSHSLLKLCVGLLDSANLLCWHGVGNHDGSLDLAGSLFIGLFHNHLDIGSGFFHWVANSDALADVHILSAGAREVGGAAAVLLESSGSGLNRRSVRGGGDNCGGEELYKGDRISLCFMRKGVL